MDGPATQAASLDPPASTPAARRSADFARIGSDRARHGTCSALGMASPGMIGAHEHLDTRGRNILDLIEQSIAAADSEAERAESEALMAIVRAHIDGREDG